MKIILFALPFLAACGGSAFVPGPVLDASDSGARTTVESPPDSGPMHEDTSPAAQVDAQVDAGVCSEPTTPLFDGTNGISGGLQFHVTQDTVLTSFDFTSDGSQEDTVTLYDSQCNLITSASTPPSPISAQYVPYTVRVDWPLKAGETYILTNKLNAAGYASAPGPFPYTSGILVVEMGLTQCPTPRLPFGQAWTAFSDLTFCN